MKSQKAILEDIPNRLSDLSYVSLRQTRRRNRHREAKRPSLLVHNTVGEEQRNHLHHNPLIYERFHSFFF